MMSRFLGESWSHLFFPTKDVLKYQRVDYREESPRGGKILKAVGWSWGEIGYYMKNSKGKKCKKLNDRSQEQPILSSGNGTDMIPAHMFTFFIFLKKNLIRKSKVPTVKKHFRPEKRKEKIQIFANERNFFNTAK